MADGKVRKVGSFQQLSSDASFIELVGSHVVPEGVETSESRNGDAADLNPTEIAQPVAHMITKHVHEKGLTGVLHSATLRGYFLQCLSSLRACHQKYK
jgi:hypothetical protein